jgi:hypothetical protein
MTWESVRSIVTGNPNLPPGNPNSEKETYVRRHGTFPDPAALKFLATMQNFLAKIDRLEEAIDDYGNRLFNEPDEDYGENQNWFMISGYAEAFSKSGIFDIQALKTNLDLRYTKIRGLMYSCLENMTDRDWIELEVKWEALKTHLQEYVRKYQEYEPPPYSSKYAGSLNVGTGTAESTLSSNGSLSLMLVFQEAFSEDEETGEVNRIPNGTYTLSESSWGSGGGGGGVTPPKNQTYQKLEISNWKQCAFWGQEALSAFTYPLFQEVLKNLDAASASVSSMAGDISKYKKLGKQASETLSLASPLMNADMQVGTEDKLSMVGVHRLSSENYDLFHPGVGVCAKAWRESRELKKTEKKRSVSDMTPAEIRNAIITGRTNEFIEDAADIEVLRQEYINSRVLQSIGFFTQAQQMYDSYKKHIRKYKWLD